MTQVWDNHALHRVHKRIYRDNINDEDWRLTVEETTREAKFIKNVCTVRYERDVPRKNDLCVGFLVARMKTNVQGEGKWRHSCLTGIEMRAKDS